MGNVDTLPIRGTESSAAQRVGPPIATAVETLMRDFLTWVACKPRTYTEAMEAWRSSCPRFTIWEDALSDGLICVAYGSGVKSGGPSVNITTRGPCHSGRQLTPPGEAS